MAKIVEQITVLGKLHFFHSKSGRKGSDKLAWTGNFGFDQLFFAIYARNVQQFILSGAAGPAKSDDLLRMQNMKAVILD
jgi:hypothetical protein